MESVRIKPLVEGALLAALVALLGLLSFYIGFGWLLPIPVFLAYVRNGARNCALVAVVGAALLALWIGPLPALASFVFTIALGLIPGWVIHREATASVAIAAMSVALILATGLGALTAILVWHTNIWAQAWTSLTGFLDAHARQVEAISSLSPQEMALLFLRVAPVLGVSVAVLQSAGVYLFSCAALGRLGHPIPSLPPFAEWRVPPAAAWVYAVVLAGLFLGRGNRVADVVALNLSMAVGTMYTVTGGAVIYGWLRRRGVGRDLAAVTVVGGVGLLDAFGFGVGPAALGLLASLRVGPRQLGVRRGSDGEGSR